MAHCPCGRIGADCAQPGYVLHGETFEVAEATVLHGSCPAETALGCFVNRFGEASCVCNGGYEGVLCEDRIELKPVLLLTIGFGLPIIVAAIAVYYLRGSIANAWKLPATKLVSGRASIRTLLFFRIAAALCLAAFSGFLLRAEGGNKVGFTYRFLSAHNVAMSSVYFVIGARLCVLAKLDGESPPLNHELRGLERVHYVLFAVVWPLSIYVAFAVWGVLFPVEFNTGVYEFFGFSSIGMHILVQCFVGVDYLMSSQPVYLPFLSVIILAGCAFVLFHNSMMSIEFLLGLPHAPSYRFLRLDSMIAPIMYLGTVIVAAFIYIGAYALDRALVDFRNPRSDLASLEDGKLENSEEGQQPADVALA